MPNNNIRILDINGRPISAELVAAFTIPELKKSFVAINNGDLVFNQDSLYNNLDILEIVQENKNTYYVSDVLDEEWEIIQQGMIREFFSKIK